MLLLCCSKPAVALTVLAYAGDWGYLICQTPDTAAALEAASEDADTGVSGHMIRIQSLTTASRMFSSAPNQSTSTSSSIVRWKPFAAYAVYPGDYSHRPHDEYSFDDYCPDDCLSDGYPGRPDGIFFPDGCTPADGEPKPGSRSSSPPVQACAGI